MDLIYQSSRLELNTNLNCSQYQTNTAISNINWAVHPSGIQITQKHGCNHRNRKGAMLGGRRLMANHTKARVQLESERELCQAAAG